MWLNNEDLNDKVDISPIEIHIFDKNLDEINSANLNEKKCPQLYAIYITMQQMYITTQRYIKNILYIL